MIPRKQIAIILEHKMSLDWISMRIKQLTVGIIKGTTGNSNIQKTSWLGDFQIAETC